MQQLRQEGAAYLAERLKPKAWNPVTNPVTRVPGDEAEDPGSRQSYDAHTQALYFGLLRDTDTRLNESGFYDTFFTNDNNASVQLRVASLTPAEENRTRGGKLIFAEPRERM